MLPPSTSPAHGGKKRGGYRGVETALTELSRERRRTRPTRTASGYRAETRVAQRRNGSRRSKSRPRDPTASRPAPSSARPSPAPGRGSGEDRRRRSPRTAPSRAVEYVVGG